MSVISSEGIFEPIVPKRTELPVIFNIHGGGLIDGNKGVEHFLGHMGSDPKLISCISGIKT